MRSVLFIAAVLATIGCQSRKQTSALPGWMNNAGDGVLLVEYRRTPCFGACPAFTFQWFADGSVVYDGKQFVDRTGRHTGKLDREQFARVLEVADRIGYTQMETVYDNKMVTDLPATTTSILGETGPHSVLNRYQGPDALNELYQVLDALLLEVNWVASANAQ